MYRVYLSRIKGCGRRMKDPGYAYETFFLMSLPAILLFLLVFTGFMYAIDAFVENPPDNVTRYWTRH
jgi:hypothetical protein